jgi:tetratricopeptide (TPR) repeat protein
LRRLSFILGGVFTLSAALGWAMPSVAADPIRADLTFGRADSALLQLNAILAQDPSDADAHNLRCRVYYQEERWDRAISDCEAAVHADPSNSNDHLWLGRAYGQKASHTNLIAAYKLAHKVAAEFQQAVLLDPNNAAALSDLGEFDVSAPPVVGGGLQRADGVVAQLQAVNPSSALFLHARIAEAQKNYAAAEGDYKAAIAQSSNPAGPWMDLASFYRRRKRYDEMVAAIHTGASLDPNHGPALVDGAANLIQANLEPQTAIQLLQQYLNSQAQSEDSPAFAVRAKLAQLLVDQGDSAGAQEQIAAARALASGYRVPSQGHASAAGI